MDRQTRKRNVKEVRMKLSTHVSSANGLINCDSSRTRKKKKEYSEDFPSYKMTLESKWKRQCKESRDEELERLIQMGTWILHPKAEIPAGTKILKNTWAFLIKR